MNQFKPIISHQEGQNLFPGIPTIIKGDKAATHITMKNTKPQIAITPYGASYMSPGQDYAFAGDTVGEFPMAQMGGQEDDGQAQIMQILQIYAQMKQIPIQQLIQQIQNLSEEEQQQSITAIAQEVQQVMQEQQQQQMAQQQMPMGQEEMGMAEEEMPMAMQGGKACIDCEEQFPQAQNLNWFYKMHGGEAFPQANKYPEDWANYSGTQYAQGGEAFPQAQTYLPYDKGSKPAPNFMFQQGGTLYDYGGSTDIDQIYKIMKANGFDMNPKKKKGGAFSKETFNEYVMRNGGNLPMHQILGQANFNNQGGIGEFYKQQKPTQSFQSPYDEFSFSDEYKNQVANFNKTKKQFAEYSQNSEQKRREAEARKAAELKKALSYNVGKGSVNMFGPKTSAVFGLLGMGADAAKGFSGGYLYDELPKPNSDDIQYQPCFPGMPCFHEEGQGSDNTLNQGNLNLSQTNNLSSQGSLGMWQYGGANTSAFNSGVFDQIAALREKQAYKKLYDKDTTTSGLFDLGAAEKTPQGAPIGTINYAGYNTYNTGDQNFGYGNYPSQYLNNFRYGGNILDQYEDGTEIEIPDDQLEDFVNAIYAAGGSVDFI